MILNVEIKKYSYCGNEKIVTSDILEWMLFEREGATDYGSSETFLEFKSNKIFEKFRYKMEYEISESYYVASSF